MEINYNDLSDEDCKNQSLECEKKLLKIEAKLQLNSLNEKYLMKNIVELNKRLKKFK